MNKQAEDIKTIREMMEKSSKFQSLNGLSIAIAGIIALTGAVFAYFYMLQNRLNAYERDAAELLEQHAAEIRTLFVIALFVLLCAVAVITFFTWLKARKNNQKLLNAITLRAAYNLLIPLAAGGIFSLIFLLKGNIEIVISSTLIFYGLGLVNASKYTFNEIHYLGIVQLVIGLFAAYFEQNNILLWAVGFGFFHILFGIIMYIKHDRKK